MTHPVGEPGEAKRFWLHNLEPQNAGKLFGRAVVQSKLASTSRSSSSSIHM